MIILLLLATEESARNSAANPSPKRKRAKREAFECKPEETRVQEAPGPSKAPASNTESLVLSAVQSASNRVDTVQCTGSGNPAAGHHTEQVLRGPKKSTDIRSWFRAIQFHQVLFCLQMTLSARRLIFTLIDFIIMLYIVIVNNSCA